MGAIEGCTFGEIEGPPYDLIINATSASLQGVMPELPGGLVERGDRLLRHGLRPRPSRPSRAGQPRSTPAGISKGWGMLVEQAAESFLLWRGIRPSTQPVLAALNQEE